MNSMIKLSVAVFLVAVVAIAPVINQPSNPFGKGPFNPFPKPPNFPRPGSQGNPNKLPSLPTLPLRPVLRPRIPRFCDLTVPKATRDASIVKTVRVGSRGASASAPRSSDVQRAVNSAAKRGGPDGQVVKGFLNAARKIAASKARAVAAAAAARAAQNTKGRAPDRSNGQTGPAASFLSPTTKTNMCTSVEKQIVTVWRGNQKCDTIAPQEVLNYECRSRFCSAPNPLPLVQRYYCKPGNKVWTSWYVYCRKSRDIQVHSAEISINCCCFKHSCNFTPYSATSPLKF